MKYIMKVLTVLCSKTMGFSLVEKMTYSGLTRETFIERPIKSQYTSQKMV